MIPRFYGLDQLRAVVRHVGDGWRGVIMRRQYVRSIAESKALHETLLDTYAAHLHNALWPVLAFDLIRQISVLILDPDTNSASVVRAVALLGNKDVSEQLREASWEVTPSKFADAEAAQAVCKSLKSHSSGEYTAITTELRSFRKAVLSSQAAKDIWTVRNKAVAHNEIEHDGSNWRLWRVEGTELTYGQVDAFVDPCTSAVDCLQRLVFRERFCFEDLPEIGGRYAADYIEALVTGLNHQRAARDEKRTRTLERMAAIARGGQGD